MKIVSKVAVILVAVLSFVFTSCGDSKPTETTGNTNTEDLVDGADGGLDSLNLPNDTTTIPNTTAQ